MGMEWKRIAVRVSLFIIMAFVMSQSKRWLHKTIARPESEPEWRPEHKYNRTLAKQPKTLNTQTIQFTIQCNQHCFHCFHCFHCYCQQRSRVLMTNVLSRTNIINNLFQTRLRQLFFISGNLKILAQRKYMNRRGDTSLMSCARVW